MPEDNKCQSCPERQGCQEVYRQLGQSEGPPVTLNVLIAFVLPLVIFIACLAAGLAIVSKIDPDLPAIPISLAAAVLVTALYVVLASLIVKKRNKKLE